MPGVWKVSTPLDMVTPRLDSVVVMYVWLEIPDATDESARDPK